MSLWILLGGLGFILGWYTRRWEERREQRAIEREEAEADRTMAEELQRILADRRVSRGTLTREENGRSRRSN